MEKYTVIIPVRDSGDTIRHTLETCLRQTYENFHIIVSDNVSSDRTRSIVESVNDSRVRYINTGRRMSMAENFDFALSHATDGYVMFIGGDDGLLPGAIDYVDEIVRKYAVKAVSCRWAHYVWPNFPDQSISGDIRLCGFGNELNMKGGVEIRTPLTWLERALSYKSLYVYDLANLYYGFVHRDIINKSIVDGKYFRSVTPDAYAAFATTLTLDSYAFSYRPFCICGASGKSNGASALHEKSASDESVKFSVENNLPIHKDFVYCPSLEIIATEALAQYLNMFPEKSSKVKIDLPLMLSRASATTNGKTESEVLSAVQKMAGTHKIVFPLEGYDDRERASSLSFLLRVKVLLANLFCYLGVKDSVRISVNDIGEASTLIGFMIELNGGFKPDQYHTRVFRRMKSIFIKAFK